MRTLHPMIFVGVGLDLVGFALLVAAFAVQPVGPWLEYDRFAGIAVLVAAAITFYGLHKHAETA